MFPCSDFICPRLPRSSLCDSNVTVLNGFYSTLFLHDVHKPEAKNIMLLECCYIAYSEKLFPPIIPCFPAVLIGHRTHPSCTAECTRTIWSDTHTSFDSLHYLSAWSSLSRRLVLSQSYNTHTHTHTVQWGVGWGPVLLDQC